MTTIKIESAAVQYALAENAYQEHAATNIMVGTGGAMSFFVTEKLIELNVQAATTELAKETFKNLTLGPNVVLIEEFLVGLSEEEVEAITQHEVGHCELGHVNAGLNDDMEKNGGSSIVLQLDMELAADRYSALRVGAMVLVSALSKLTDNIFTVGNTLPGGTSIFGGISKNEWDDHIRNNGDFQARLTALRAMA